MSDDAREVLGIIATGAIVLLAAYVLRPTCSDARWGDLEGKYYYCCSVLGCWQQYPEKEKDQPMRLW